MAESTFRMTRQRRAILDQLRESDEHPTADLIYERVRRRLPRISLGTVYRNLEAMAERGMIRTLQPPDSPKRFDGRPEMHYHVRCVDCGRIEDVPAEPLGALRAKAARRTGYQVLGHRLEFEGRCPDCRRADRSQG